MKACLQSLMILYFLAVDFAAHAQNGRLDESTASELESLAEKNGAVPDHDDVAISLEYFKRHPLNLNTAGPDELNELHLLHALQVNRLLTYRKLLGPLLSVYELQALPGWDMETIRSILPYVLVRKGETVYSAVRERWSGGDAEVEWSAGQVIEKSRGFEKPLMPGAAYYEGSPQKISMRYTYTYQQFLSYGLTGDKDAGEPFFRNAQRYGFDFYSFHFCIQHYGWLRALVIGDFSVNLGQGLIQWQRFSFTKGSQVLAVKRESACFMPYQSAGEFNFHRGIGISLQKGQWEASLFLSSQKISTNKITDSSGLGDDFSSFENTGYHRTAAEIADRYNNHQFSAGGNLRYQQGQFSMGLNWIHFQFGNSLHKQELPYNRFSFTGRHLEDYSLDYSYTIRNLHLFGELASDHTGNMAWVQGLLLSLNENLDMSLLYRKISPAFHSLYSRAFTENSVPQNEEGVYTGLAIRPFAGIFVDIYHDLYQFPWLKYGVDGPSAGRDLFIRLKYQPDKSSQFTAYFKNETKTVNGDLFNRHTHGLTQISRRRWHTEAEYRLSRHLDVNCRMEILGIRNTGSGIIRGFMGMAGLGYRGSGFSGNMAAGFFETDDYVTRIYMYEPDMLFHFSLPDFYGSGFHYYINLHRDFSRKIPAGGKRIRFSGWIKWSQTFYPGSTSLGTGLDEIRGNRKSELRAQIVMQWR